MSDDKTIIAEQSMEHTHLPSGRHNPVLVQYDGGSPGKKFHLSEVYMVIGRSPKTHVWVDDKSVSREHCRIDWDGQKALVTDLGSTNHTFINDRKLEMPSELHHGDMLKVGNVRLRFFSHGSEEELLVDKIYSMAVKDNVLEIFRKEYLLEKIEEEIRLSRMTGEELCLAMFDLDKFKLVNDTYGHDAGDVVLKEVATLVKKMLPASYVFGRYGGEEFTLIYPKTSLQDAAHFADEVRLAIQALEIEHNGVIIPVTVSMGVARLTPVMKNYMELIKDADILLYQSKQNGRNRISVAS